MAGNSWLTLAQGWQVAGIPAGQHHHGKAVHVHPSFTPG